MRASDACAGDILCGIPEMYLREVRLDGMSDRAEWDGYGPNRPELSLVSHRWMGWAEKEGFRRGGTEVFVYIGRRWVYRKTDGKTQRKIVREVLYRGRPCHVDPDTWRYIERVEDCQGDDEPRDHGGTPVASGSRPSVI